MARERTSYDAQPKVRPPFNMDALVQGGPDIEVVSADQDLKKLMSDTKFMNEIVYVRFLDGGDPNAPRMIEVSVNTAGQTGPWRKPTEDFPDGRPGVAQGGGKAVQRGYERNKVYPMERYILEAVAHSKFTTLSQVPHPTNPNEIMQVERTSFSYPHEVVRDDNPKGAAWLEKVRSDPA